MSERDDILDRVIAALREPVRIDPDVDRRVMAEIRAQPGPARAVGVGAFLEWLRRRRTIQLSPLGGLAMAAGLVALVVVGSRLAAPAPVVETVETAAAPVAASTIQFVLVAPRAQSVSLVGDFNDWDASATPLRPDPTSGIWSVTVPLAPGRYQYSFLVDGTTWLRDPRAAPALDDEFGTPSSVLTIGGL